MRFFVDITLNGVANGMIYASSPSPWSSSSGPPTS